MAELSNAFIARLRTIDVGFHMPLVESMILRAALLSDGNAVQRVAEKLGQPLRRSYAMLGAEHISRGGS